MRGNLFYIVHPAGQLKELNRSASLGKLEEKLETLHNAIEKLDPDECTAAVNRLSQGIDRVLGVIQRAYPEEPKARPFTITEFNERFKLGSSVHFIEKDGGHERRVMYTGYCVDKSEACVYLGPRAYKLQYLFDNCKLAIGYMKKDDREEPLWGVFGADPGVYKYEE